MHCVVFYLYYSSVLDGVAHSEIRSRSSSAVKMQTHDLQCVPGFTSHVPGIQIGTYVSADATDEHLQM